MFRDSSVVLGMSHVGGERGERVRLYEEKLHHRVFDGIQNDM